MHCELKKVSVVILNFNGLFDSKARWRLFKDNDFELLIPLGRMHFFNDQCKGNSPNFQSVYVCHQMLDHQIEFCEGESGLEEEVKGQVHIDRFLGAQEFFNE